jgi:hypothetical protein
MAVRVNPPTWESWDPRNNLPPNNRGGIAAVNYAWGTVWRVVTETIPQFWTDIGNL